MLSSADILALPYDEQYSRAGVQYARDSLHQTYAWVKADAANRLRGIVAGVAFEMATRRWLEAASIRYDRLGPAGLAQPDQLDLAVGGRRCDLKFNLITDKTRIGELHARTDWALEAEALVPEEQLDAERMGEQDVYIFGFVTGLEARSLGDTAKAQTKGLPVYMLHLPPYDLWARPEPWESLGDLVFKSNAEEPLRIEIGGQDSAHKAVRERVKLPPHTRMTALRDYYTLLYVGTPKAPVAALGVHSPGLKQTQIVEPLDWENLWLYGQRVYLCGWLNKHDFRAQGRRLPAGSPVKQAARIDAACCTLPVSQLRAMAELAEIALKHQKK